MALPTSSSLGAVIGRLFREEFPVQCMRLALGESPREVSWGFLRSSLHEITALYEAWLAKNCPTDLRHALLLPPTFFKTTSETTEYWHKCEVYSTQRIPEAERVLQIVEQEHRRPDNQGGRSWIDDRKWRYRFDRSKHGISATNRAGRARLSVFATRFYLASTTTSWTTAAGGSLWTSPASERG